ncbi:TA13C protein, partial [Atractosteus spatula]|nr:TA13C protein [Atractosteus spatula]
MVIISISHFKQLHTPTNLLLLSLAVADFLIGLIVMPFEMIRYIETCWYFGWTFCTIFYSILSILTVVSLINVVFISIVRYFAMCDPLRYSNKITSNVMYSCIILIWSFSILYVLMVVIFNINFRNTEEVNACHGECVFEMSAPWVIVDILVSFILPCTVMIALYIKIFIVAKRHAQLICSVTEHKTCKHRNRSKVSKRSERKAAKTLGIVVAVFLLLNIFFFSHIMELNEVEGHQIVQYCFSSDNTSCQKETRSTAVYVILYVFFISEVMLTVCGNLLVIISVYHFKQLHTPTNLLLLSLAVADFLIGLIVMPFAMIRYIETCWYFGRIFCIIFYSVFLILTVASLINVVFISIDRYVAVCDPLRYSNKITVNVMCQCIIFMWSFSVLYMLIIIIGNINFVKSVGENLHTPTNLLLLSLAVADFLIGLIVMPFAMIRTCWYFGRTSCIIFCSVLFILTVVSLINVVFISIDRYVAVCDPLRYSNKITLHTPTNLILLSLAVADFLVGVTVLPLTMTALIETCWYFGDMLCSLYLLLDSVLISVSLSNLVLIAIDRYFAICDPLFYSTKISLHTPTNLLLLSLAVADFLVGTMVMPLFLFLILCSWLLLPLYRLALLYFNGNFDGPDTLSICLRQCFFVMSANWRIIDVIVTLILPCSIMIGLYVNIFIVVTRQARVISSITQQILSTDKRRDKISKKSEQKAAKTLGIVVFVFLFCWVPYYLCVLIEEEIHTSSGVLYFLGFIVYLNSVMNPIIYALFYPWFQKSVKLIITLRITLL